MATSAYRNLWRSANVAFRGDTRMLTAARASIRTGFQTNRHLEPSSPEIAPALQHANEVAMFLRQNVVQGKKLDGDEDRYKLNIHDETERGDNDTIKFAGKKMARAGDAQPSAPAQKCCSQ